MVRTISKTVSVETLPIETEYRHEVKEIFGRTEACLNHLYGRFCGIKSLDLIQNRFNLRDYLRQDMKENGYDLCENYHIPGRYWVAAAFQCSENLKSNWSNLGNKIKTQITQNNNLSEDEKHYIRYVVSVPHYWYCVLNHKKFEPNKTLSEIKIDESRLHYVHNLICRMTRDFKFKKPKAKNLSCIMLDEVMYKIYDKDGKTYLEVMGLTPRKPMVFELKSEYHYDRKGNVQLIYNRERNVLEIHKCIQTKVKPKAIDTKKSLGVDKGYSTLLSCSNDNEYGFDFGDRLTAQAEYINKNTKAKNEIRDTCKKLNEDITSMSPSDKRTNMIKKLWHLKECNSGTNVFDKKQERFKDRSEQSINESIKKMLNNSDAAVIAIEDLGFERPMTPAKGKAYNRRMSMWCKGMLDKRLEYVPPLHGVKTEKVNAAYTSQFCACCGAQLTERKGKHAEIGVCPNCGEINANINAAKNIQARLKDKEITLYTPHKKIKEILLKRYQAKLEKQSKKKSDESTKRKTKTETNSATSGSTSEKIA